MNGEQDVVPGPERGFGARAIPLLAICDAVVFPTTVATALVTEEVSLAVVSHVLEQGRTIALVTQRTSTSAKLRSGVSFEACSSSFA
jgi:hypothetical protein